MKIASRLVTWQRLHGRHGLPWQGTRDPYRVWLSEIMLQQTQVAAVLDYYQRFLSKFPTVKALAQAPASEVIVPRCQVLAPQPPPQLLPFAMANVPRF